MFHVGDVVRKLRKDAELTLEDLSGMTGLSKTTLSTLERTGANYERETLQRIARALDVTESGIYARLERLQAGDAEAVDEKAEFGRIPSSPVQTKVEGLMTKEQQTLLGILDSLSIYSAPVRRRFLELARKAAAEAIGNPSHTEAPPGKTRRRGGRG